MTTRVSGSAALRGARRLRVILHAAFAILACGCGRATQRGATPVPAALDVHVVADEADAVLAILDARGRGDVVPETAWTRLFSSEGYTRLKARELSLRRAFTDSAFRAFVLSPDLAARAPGLAATLAGWRRIDATAAGARALAYLPAGTRLRARMYPVIKPLPNSFVFETETNPAIFLYLDPSRSPASVENTLAHELHHVGVAAACPEATDSGLPATLRRARNWASGFAEGRAMLAAAGGPDLDPHATSTPAEHAVWDRNLALAPRDFGRLEEFFGHVLAGRLQGDSLRAAGFAFVNAEGAPQGAFYTVGWLMSAVVEKELGRARLVESLCDPARFLQDYERAARAANRHAGAPAVPGAPVPLPLWSDTLLGRLRGARR